MRRLGYVLPLIVCWVFLGSAQNKYEREHRILKKQFPQKASSFVLDKVKDVKRVRYYKEIDSAKVSYEIKLKKDKLHYSIEFDQNGVLEDIEITIKQVDIPEDSWANITRYLYNTFQKWKVQKIQQQYPVSEDESHETTIQNAFQNLLLPSLNYELVVSTQKEGKHQPYEVLFDAHGNFKKLRKSLPPNYDHVLY
ncbi:MAG: hypothetical protein AAGA86_09285 [Bacteroidota bacterium]